MNEEYINDTHVSDCCDAPILGEITEGFGICSHCREWAEAKNIKTEEVENIFE